MDRGLVGFLVLYTLLMTACYSLIPYKTPWCLLGFFHGMILLAGAGALHVAQAFRRPQWRGIAIVLLVAAGAHLGWQAYAASFHYEADPRNPYVYAHTGTDVFGIVRRVEALAGAHPDGNSMPVQIISSENLWPLPWYLRRLTGVRWSTAVLDRVPSAPLILITPDMETALTRKLYELPPPGQRELYMNIFDRRIQLRPGVEVCGYAAKSLWDEYLETGVRKQKPEVGSRKPE
jgi:predicted membrane-bound mannosyltransferase